MAKIDDALDLAIAGFPIFPGVSNKKSPAVEGGFKAATCDLDQVAAWWTKNPEYNIGLATGNGLFVIDCDVRKDGKTDLDDLIKRGLKAKTIVRTPSGGQHCYLRYNPENVKLASSTRKIAPDTDHRADGGYVLAPGSSIDGHAYEWERGELSSLQDAEEMPQWLIDLCRKKPREKEKPLDVQIELDTPPAIEWAKSYLINDAPCAIQGEGGDHTTFTIAALLHDHGVSEEICLDLMLEWNREKAIPPWSPDDLEQKVRNAFRYAENPAGCRSPFAEFGAYPFEIRPRAKTAPANMGRVDKSEDAAPSTVEEWLTRDLPEPDFLMGHVFSTTNRSLLVAPTGLGKTNFGFALALHMSAGVSFLQWNGRRLARGLYIDGEMSNRLMRKRLVDALRRFGSHPEGLHIMSFNDIEEPHPLRTREGQALVEDRIKRMGGCDFIVFDSVMALIGGEMTNEESWRETMPWIRSLTRRGIGQLWVHHTGIDESRSYGTKTREWEMDNVILLERVERPDSEVSFKVCFSKAREREPETRHEFEAVKVALVDDAWTHEPVKAKSRTKAPPLALEYLDALIDALSGNDAIEFKGKKAATMDMWKAQCVRRGLIDKNAKPDSARALFSKNRSQLVASKAVACQDDLAWVI